MYRKKHQNWIKHLDFIVADLFEIFLAYAISIAYYLGDSLPYNTTHYRVLCLAYLASDALMLIAVNTYRNVLQREYSTEFFLSLGQSIILTAVVTAFMFFTKTGISYSRVVVLITGILYVIINVPSRCLMKHYLRKYGLRKKHKDSLIIITVTDKLDEVKQSLDIDIYRDYKINGFIVIDQDMEGQTINGIPVVGNARDFKKQVIEHWVDQILVVYPNDQLMPYDVINPLLIAGITVHVKLFDRGRVADTAHLIENMGAYTVLTTSIQNIPVWKMALKRLLDIIGGLIGTAITGILYLILAPQIKSLSPGPVFFKQERIGRNGRHFLMYKFRSMYMDAEERKKELYKENNVKDGMMFKMDADPRIIGSRILPDGTYQKGLGNRIRDWSLDEFPQFWNVLKGDMSLVGTRPPTLDEWKKYELQHRARMSIKPGITGMWQVSGRSNIKDFEEVVRLDTEYIRNWSFRLDLRILGRTITSVLKREGAE